MEFRFVQKKDYDHIFYIQKKVNFFIKNFWFPIYKIKPFFAWYFIGVGLQFLFGLLFGFIFHLVDSKVAVTHLITSEMYFVCAWIFPLFNTLFTTKMTVNFIDFADKFYINIDAPRIFSAFCKKYSEFALMNDETERVVIDKNNIFLVNKKTFLGKTKKVYHIGIKQLRKEKLEHLFS